MSSETEMVVQAPWGRLIMVSWGKKLGPPVLLLHGRQDSLATFYPLKEYLPPDFHYVAVDMPGNGKSDAFPHGVKITRFHYIRAMEEAVEYLGWKTFAFIGHSMGCEQGLFYNALYPGRITKMVFLDPEPSFQRIQHRPFSEYQQMYYDKYYDDYQRENYSYKTYTKSAATAAVQKARGLTPEQAEIIISRNLIPVGENLYKLSWDQRLKSATPQNFPNEYYISLFTKSLPPTLMIAATKEHLTMDENARKGAKEFVEVLSKLPQIEIKTVKGGHDVHITNCESVGPLVREFLLRIVTKKVDSKL